MTHSNIVSKYRTHTCGELNEKQVGQTVRVAGWVQKIRDHGGLVFVDLRDHYGLTQCVFNVSDSAKLKEIEKISAESVIIVDGAVVSRTAETINENIPTGKIEIVATSFEVISKSELLPILVASDEKFPEELRLKYRYIDLRKEKLKANIMKRIELFKTARHIMEDEGFNEIQTPILTSSSPEGARDFVVPSRVHHGKFYALPQSPQQFKQLLMIAGFDRYFQLAPCFRDEDGRGDRLLEFYQLDVEMSFVDEEDVRRIMQAVVLKMFNQLKMAGKIIDPEIIEIPHAESMEKYGIDRPDLRNPLIIADVSEVFKGSDFGLFAEMVEKGARVKAIPAPKTANNPRSWFDKMNDWARTEGAGGLGYIVYNDDGTTKGPIANKLDAARIAQIKEIANAQNGDTVFFACNKKEDVQKFAGKVRIKLGNDLDLIDRNVYKFCWIVDFPFFEKNEETGKIDFGHNPFSMPRGAMDALTNTADPFEIRAQQYDFVCNGYEIGGGSIRNYDPEIMVKAFEMCGYGRDVVEAKFPALFNAFSYGAPIHGGMALGMERLVMLLTDEISIREVVPFPPNGKGQDALMGAPSELTEDQLREAHVKVRPTVK